MIHPFFAFLGFVFSVVFLILAEILKPKIDLDNLHIDDYKERTTIRLGLFRTIRLEPYWVGDRLVRCWTRKSAERYANSLGLNQFNGMVRKATEEELQGLDLDQIDIAQIKI